MTRGGLPHSEIPGSKLICSSPGLIAACHVLHRLLAPRHSPYTLSSLTIRNSRTDDHRRACIHTDRRQFLCKHCVFVVGKNYRLQNIQLSKISLGGYAPQTIRSLARGNPLVPLRSLAGESGPLSDPIRSTEAAKSITSSLGRCATRAARSRPKPATTKRWTSAKGDSTASLTRR